MKKYLNEFLLSECMFKKKKTSELFDFLIVLKYIKQILEFMNFVKPDSEKIGIFKKTKYVFNEKIDIISLYKKLLKYDKNRDTINVLELDIVLDINNPFFKDRLDEGERTQYILKLHEYLKSHFGKTLSILSENLAYESDNCIRIHYTTEMISKNKYIFKISICNTYAGGFNFVNNDNVKKLIKEYVKNYKQISNNYKFS